LSDRAETAATEGAGGDSGPLLLADGVSKRFGGVQAVDDVTVEIGRGEVHGLVGENGAGKSTLAKMMGGVHEPDGGRIVVDGEAVRFHSPRDALAAGIATIAQEIALVPARTVLENVFLGIEPRRLGVVRSGVMRQRFDELCEQTGLWVAPDVRVGFLSIAAQQRVEILRALARAARLILMDEPTSSLTANQTEQLHELIRNLAAAGTSVVLVSHFLDEVLEICDTVSVLRDGRLVRSGPAAAETADSLVRAMIGKPIELTFPPKTPPPDDAPVVLEGRGLRRAGVVDDVSLTVRAGEIVGLAGLVGSGRSEIARAFFGADRIDAGEILVEGKPVTIRNPRAAARAGIAMLPESRKDQGLLMIRSIRENETIAALPDFARLGVVNTRTERTFAREQAQKVDVRAPTIEAPVASLSGGNQQKVLFAKWLARRPVVLLADEPTRGVDVGAKAQIHDLIAELAGEGMGVLLISSELEEVLGLAHRVLVVRGGRIVADLAGDDATREAVMAAAFGTQQEAEEATT
jgi:ABC-type sugar transport system ATPase subunit